jgi:hypothetical protein
MAAGKTQKHTREVSIGVSVSLLAATAFYFSTKATLHDLDYTAQIASALLRGQLGLREQPPDWLNEMIPYGDRYYSAFPLGAVLSMIPIALLQKASVIHNFPGHIVAAMIAGGCVYFFFQLARAFGSDYATLQTQPLIRRTMLALYPVFGTWMWCNLGFGGAWQVALGLAVLGQAGALYFTLVRPSPLLAGTFFALAFGNRTELLITLPVYIYFFWQGCSDGAVSPCVRNQTHQGASTQLRKPSRGRRGGYKIYASVRVLKQELWANRGMIIRFVSIPITLALLTAVYNFARFHSIFDFGYTHIPEVRDEPWYAHGLFSIHAIPWNIYTMLFQGFESISYFPYIQPDGFGCSIVLASPFLCLLFRRGGKYKVAAWLTIAALTLVLWCHGNPGSWQFSYRYAMILLPWIFLLLTGNGPPRITAGEVSLFIVSVTINAIATWQFLWTEQIQP